MITPLIEKAVLNNWGTLQNFSLGGGGLVKFNVPKNHFAIITDFEYYPYVYTWPANIGDAETEVEKFTFQEVCFYALNKTFKWTFKVNFNVFDNGTKHVYVPSQNFKVDTYLYVENDLYCQFKTPSILDGAGVAEFGTLQFTQLPQSPETCGNQENTCKGIADMWGAKFVFPSALEAGQIVGNTTLSTINASSASEFWPTTIGGAPTSNIQLPLINIQALIVAEQNRNLLNQRT
jgi:hypothetical protein